MKTIRLTILSLAALVFARPRGFCTANTLTEDVAAINDRLAKVEAENADLKAQLAAAQAAPAPVEDLGTLALLCKGAGVELRDVKWRVQAGLDPEQAVQAALAQRAADAAQAERDKLAKKKPAKEDQGFALLGVLLTLLALLGSVLLMPLTGWPIPTGVLAACALFGVFRNRLATANAESNTGTHGGVDTKLADAQHASRHLLVKVGSDADHIAVLAAASDQPVGVCSDSPNAAEDPANVYLLGVAKGTVRMLAATALAAGIDVYGTSTGYISALPGIAGTYWKVGRTRQIPVIISTGIYEAEVEPCLPEKTLVIATATGTAATDIAALFTAMQSGPAKIKSL